MHSGSYGVSWTVKSSCRACTGTRAAGSREVPIPEGEPDRDKMTADLYYPYYEVKKGLFGPARITDAGISILNRRSYQRDEELVEIAGERLMSAILSKESREIIEASGGVEGIRSKIGADEFYG